MTVPVRVDVADSRRELFGVQAHDVGLEAALLWAHDRIAARLPGYVVTLNGSLLVQATRDPDLRELINGAALVTADGIGVILAARIMGVPISGRVAGIDLAVALCAGAADAGYRVFLLGGAPGVAEAAAGVLRRLHPALQIVGTHHGFFDHQEEEAVRAQIRQARPELLLVALGAPRQERWMHLHSASLGVPVSIGVGGSFDVLAGRVPRAPRWMQQVGLEWLYRVLREPRRWSVVRTIPPLFLMAIRERWRRRAGDPHG